MSLLAKWLRPGKDNKNAFRDVDSIDQQALLERHPTLPIMQELFADCADLIHRSWPESQLDMLYFSHLVGNEEFTREISDSFRSITPDEMEEVLSRSQYKPALDCKSASKGVLDGNVCLFHKGSVYLVSVSLPETRSISQSETETSINGPHDGFVESVLINLSLIRRRIRSTRLKALKLQVGEVSKTDVYLLYIDGLANTENVQEMKKRIELVETDVVHDGNMLAQLIDDHPNSVFPLFQTTERTDAIASKLAGGKIVVVMDGSPSAFSAPSSFFEFFASSDDYYQRWAIGTMTRMLRFIAFVITISFTALYVSVTTFHYEMIPEDLLITITQSRSRVPFPPLYEAMLMEITIELLREAGARLPTKIGQTIGIVGGIVIGQAAVQAGLTSNILIIAVASSAIASFVIPSYVMSASIRLIRFGLLLMAGLLGNFGIVMAIAIIFIHLSGLTSLKSSYLTPVAPINFKDWLDIFIRAPFSWIQERPSQSRSPNKRKTRIKQ
ncbi:spore germination protein [Paenibacillus sp. PAMC21692]|uniref:spore germination protein n=1 Tax=Paenibacillus sp. PAMC21692 TaxID=2762320 RepID=UPI00164E1A49|nr:spore germination protein [Paenibacillus sp. PAMC21692]QNK55665.1 spore germination protein [Paenibacillus sp. PAMC21692]